MNSIKDKFTRPAKNLEIADSLDDLFRRAIRIVSEFPLYVITRYIIYANEKNRRS